jgi:hypothetical protein
MHRPRLLALSLLLILALPARGQPVPGAPADSAHPSPVSTRAATGLDTTWFGGTVWNADSARWEAVPGGTWTFDSGVGSALVPPGDPGFKEPGLHRIMEGWTGVDLTASTLSAFRRLSAPDFAGENVVCVGAPAGLGGQASLWAGVLTPEADLHCFAAGRGYGNSWNITRAKGFLFPGGGQVTVSFQYRNDTEFGWDSTLVEVVLGSDPAGPGILLASYTGSQSGTETRALSTGGGTLPPPGGDFFIRFRVVSDVAYSDEDGLFVTECGAFAVDDIALSGAVTDASDFESGEDGWQLVEFPGMGEDWSHLAAVADLPDYPGGCTLDDSVLVFFNDAGRIAARARNLALSPWIDVAEGDITNLQSWVVQFDYFQNFTRPERVGYELYYRWHPASPTQPGCRLTNPLICFFGPDPCHFYDGCADPILIPLSLVQIPTAAQRVQIALGVSNNCSSWGDCPGPNNATDPYFDNVRFGAVQAATVAVRRGGEDDRFSLVVSRTVIRSGSASLTLTAPAGSPVRLELFDVTGRRVRSLYSGSMPDRVWNARWDLRDDSGRGVPAGIYFARASGVETVARRLIVLP